MDLATIRRYLEDFGAAAEWLKELGLVDLRRGHANLASMAAAGVTLDLLAVMCGQMERHLPLSADADMALNNLERFVRAQRNPLSVGTLFERDPAAMPTLIQIFSSSQHFSDLLVLDPESFDLLRLTEGQPVSRETLVGEIVAEVEALEHDRAVLRALRRFKRRETLRIAYGDIVRGQSVEAVTAQISFLADAVVEAALRAAGRRIGAQRGTPLGPDGSPASFVVLGMGKLGGLELNYSSDIDLIFLYDHEGRTDAARPISNAEFFELLARELVRLITETTELGAAYRVDLRLRPEGRRGPMAVSVARAAGYYDSRGRTWERQAYIKARSVAGNLELGRRFLEELAPWVYRRYLSWADINGIRALKRRIERQAHESGGELRNVKTGRGGIRDIEFVIQFLQLLNGGDLPQLRTGNTLEAIARLGQVGCLSDQERSILAENYVFLRKLEHRLQAMFDLQTHTLPDDRVELRKLAVRMGYVDRPRGAALDAFQRDYRMKTELNRRILDHLLHGAFGAGETAEAEVDLVLDPDPAPERVEAVLGRHGFRDVRQAYQNLMALAEERIAFLSTRRCRHFLAAIAPRLLHAVSQTPDPDSTLVTLGRIADSLGGKGVLWELLSFNEPSLRLCVELCAYSPFLTDILTSNPGMIDSLMDSLVLDRLPTPEALRAALDELCRGAEDIGPILHSFKNDHVLRVGVRDLLGKEDVTATTGVLSDLAEACLERIVARQRERLLEKFGRPEVGAGRRRGQPCEAIILALGKFGGRELNYHSDLDLVFLYEADGRTAGAAVPGGGTSNQHFYSELAQRVIKALSQLSVQGKLYDVDARLRPTGRSGMLATSLDEFVRYFLEGDGQLWERQALCRARVVYASPHAARAAAAAVQRAVFARPWRAADAAEIRAMRARLEETASPGDLKRGPGGLVDIEFLVQMLQLRYGKRNTSIRSPNTLEALAELYAAGQLDADDFSFFQKSYRFLRTLEGKLRLLRATSRDRLPDDPTELTKLAHLLGRPNADAVLTEFDRTAREVRARFERWFEAAGRNRRPGGE